MHQKKFKEIRRCLNPNCSNLFEPYSSRQVYCCRACFKKKNKKFSKYPSFVCPNCGKKTSLDFFPCFAPRKWSEFRCECGHGNKSDYKQILEIRKQFREEEKNGIDIDEEV